MSSLRVLILYNQLLLARAIEDALREQKGLEVLAMDGAQADVYDKVKAFRPDVVVLDRHSVDQARRAIPDICLDNPGTKVITIDHGSNKVSVFRVFFEQISASEPRDLIPIICSVSSL